MRQILSALGVVTLVLAVTACGTGGRESEVSAEALGAATAEGARDSSADQAVSASGGGDASTPVVENILTPISGPRVIQTALLGISVERGRFEETVSQARTIATGLAGYVTSSSASQGSDSRLVRGTLVLRVPEAAYGQAMTQLTKLGRVRSREETGQDVSGEFVDLEARQRHLEAVEAQLLGFLKRTETIPEALAVQRRLDDVQLQLEEVRGRLAYLDDQSAFATITLQLTERGVPAGPPGGGGWSIGDAWSAAADGLTKIVGGVLVALVVAGPILLVLALAWLLGRMVLRRRRAQRTPGSALG
jgi:hypothetical protein